MFSRKFARKKNEVVSLIGASSQLFGQARFLSLLIPFQKVEE
jgi:hypothetical protein